MTLRQKKVADLVKELTAEFLERIQPKETLVTVISSTVSLDLKKSTVFITVLPDEKEDEVLRAIESNLHDLRQYLGKKMHIKFIPEVEIEIDKGEKTRQLIEKLSKND